MNNTSSELNQRIYNLLRVLADLDITETEIQQHQRYGTREIFQKGATITVAHILEARELCKEFKLETREVRK